MVAHEYSVATDVGGTFVDTVVVRDDGELFLGKASAPEGAMLASVGSAAVQANTTADDILSRARLFVNGTTVATNAMIERSGSVVGLLTTAGFEDTLIIGRVKARTAGLDEFEITNYQKATRPEPLAPVILCRGVKERIDYSGRVLLELDDDDVIRRLEELVESGAQTIAVSLLWSFRNPVHEQRIRELIAERYPDMYVTLSSRLVPVIREYERTNTTVVNSYLGPVVSRYVDGLQATIRDAGYDRQLLVMQSIGGLAAASDLVNTPVTALQSGPVGGIVAAEKLGQDLGERNLITADMGGTSFDVGLVVDGVPQTHASTVVERNILFVPTVDVASIGAGGGSLAWLDELNALHVGPRSAGADPGPACYGLGGTAPTVTDADVVLGYISPDYFAGGAMELHPELAAEAIQKEIAGPLGMSVEEAAEGIYRIVNAHMAHLIRKVSVERGFDPRDFVLVNFGGCGPTHCTGYGPEIGTRSLIVPRAASVFSAYGIAQSDIRTYVAGSIAPMTYISPEGELPEPAIADINHLFDAMSREAGEALERQDLGGDVRIREVRNLEMRYKGQTNELTIPLESEGPLTKDAVAWLVKEFVARYEMLYGRGSSSSLSPVELMSARLDVIAEPPVRFAALPEEEEGPDPSAGQVDERPIYWSEFDGYAPTPVYRGSKLVPGNRIEGPAIIEAFGTTIPLRPDQRLRVDPLSNFVITM